MFSNESCYYEIMAWKDAENPQRPFYQERYASKKVAMSDARVLSKRFNRLEVNKVFHSIYDINDIHGCELIASWHKGKKIA